MIKPEEYTHISQKIGAKLLSCLKDGKEFSVPLSELREMFDKGVCAYTGHKFLHHQHATFERVNPFLDYVPGNVVLVTQQANAQKGCLDNFIKQEHIPIEMRIKLLRKATYILEKQIKEGE